MTNNSRDQTNRELSYPSVKQTADGAIHIAFTFHRRAIKYVRVSEAVGDAGLRSWTRAHALVTGASSGIGAAIVERLLRDGWRVTGISRRPRTFDHPAFAHLSLDLARCRCHRSRRRRSRADGAGSCRGHAQGRSAGIARAMTTVLRCGGCMSTSPMRLADALAPRLPQGGRIVFIGSRTASGAAGRGQYAATKAALVALARSWASELAPRGITVNVVAPAATETPMLQRSRARQCRAKAAADRPLHSDPTKSQPPWRSCSRRSCRDHRAAARDLRRQLALNPHASSRTSNNSSTMSNGASRVWLW